MLKNILSQSWRKGAHVLQEGNPAPALYTCWSRFHSGQILSSSRSFFGVEDFVDEDNSRPYTYKKEKRSKNPHKHISFKQRTIAHMEPFTLDVFISKRFVSASLHTVRHAGRSRSRGPIRRTSRLRSSRGPTYRPAWPWAVSWRRGRRRLTSTPARTRRGSGTSLRERLGPLSSR